MTWKIDPFKASVARVYDYVLGGKDNFEIDRVMAAKVMEMAPDAALSAKVNKGFGQRATRYIAEQGVRQYIDLGSGIPTTPPSTHDSAREFQPDSNVVYVDNDPVVVSHSQALRDIGPGLVTIQADLNDPQYILDHDDLVSRIDFSEPVAVLILSVLQTVAEDEKAYAIVRAFNDRLPPGSFLALSHVSSRSAPEALAHFQRSSGETGYPPFKARTDEELMGFFDGFDLLDPGLAEIQNWRNPEDNPASPTLKLVGGVARKRD